MATSCLVQPLNELYSTSISTAKEIVSLGTGMESIVQIEDPITLAAINCLGDVLGSVLDTLCNNLIFFE